MKVTREACAASNTPTGVWPRRLTAPGAHAARLAVAFALAVGCLVGVAGGVATAQPTAANPARAAASDASRIRTGFDAVLGMKRSIRGRVTDATDSAPVVCFVTAFDSAGRQITATSTASNGDYAIALDPGTYRLRFQGFGKDYSIEYYNDALSLSAATPIVLGSESDVTGRDVALGLQTSFVQGRVTDVGGNPLRFIRVTAFGAGGVQVASEFTDFITGEYSIALDPGDYILEFEDFSDIYAAEYHNGVYNRSAATTFTIGPNQTLTGYDASLVRMSHIRGTVTDTAGNPLKDVYVWARGADGGMVGSATTSATGEYSIALAPGTYRLEFYISGGVYMQEYYDNATSLNSATPVILGIEETVTRDATLTRFSHIQGRITNASGSPLANAYATAVDSGGHWVAGAVTNPAGNYSIALAPGTYRLSFSGGGVYLSEYYDNVTTLKAAKRIVVGSERTLTGYNAALRRSTTRVVVDNPNDDIRGRVTNESGMPLGGIRVAAVDSAGNPGASTSTSSTGEYSLSLGPGIWSLRFSDVTGPYATEYYNNASTLGAATHIRVDWVSTPFASAVMSRKKSYAVSGLLMPRHSSATSSVRIYKYRLVSGVWRSAGYVSAARKNFATYTQYSKTIKLTIKGKWRLRAYHAAPGHPAIWSNNYLNVSVK